MLKKKVRPKVRVIWIAKRFGVRIWKTKWIHRGVYRIEEKNGKTYCLKRMQYSVNRIRWIDHMISQIRKNGFTWAVWRNPEEPEGKRLFIRIKSLKTNYILNPWVEGRWPSPKRLQDMRNCGSLIAEFHNASMGSASRKQGALDMIGEWPALFNSFMRVLKSSVRKSQLKSYHSPMDLLLRKYGAETIRRAKSAIRILDHSDYKTLCVNAKKQKILCHGDGGPTNFLINTKGMYLIDFETLRYDLPSYDLYRLIHNSCKDHQWNFEIARSIIEGYRSVSPLSQEVLECTKVWLRFPRGICKLLKRYPQSNQKTQLEQEFVNLIKEDRLKDSFLLSFNRYMRDEFVK